MAIGRISLSGIFLPGGQGKTYQASVSLPSMKDGTFRLIRLDPERAVNNAEVLRSGSLKELENDPLNISLAPYEINRIEISQ